MYLQFLAVFIILWIRIRIFRIRIYLNQSIIIQIRAQEKSPIGIRTKGPRSEALNHIQLVLIFQRGVQIFSRMYHTGTLYLKISPILTSHYVFQLLLLPGGGRAGEPREGPPDLQHPEGGLWPG